MPPGDGRQSSHLCPKIGHNYFLTIGSVQNLFLKQESFPQTEQFKPHQTLCPPAGAKAKALRLGPQAADTWSDMSKLKLW